VLTVMWTLLLVSSPPCLCLRTPRPLSSSTITSPRQPTPPTSRWSSRSSWTPSSRRTWRPSLCS
ncbi:hypothetical protein MHYP_G00366030, partial [Metynnis hypsauchen]